MWCATSRELASKHEPEKMTKATLTLSLLSSSKLIISTKAGAADTEETAWSALGLDCLCVRNLFSSPPSLPHKHVSRTSFFFPTGFHKFICFEKTDVASMDWSCYFPFVNTALVTGYVSESDPMAYRSYPWDVALHGGFIALFFHVLSHENKHAVLLTWFFRCVRLGARSWRIPPPKMCVIGA